MKKRKHYDNEFKVQAVKLALEIGQSKACTELNLPENTIYGWIHAYCQGKLDLGPVLTISHQVVMIQCRILFRN